jgi:type IV secretory pathway TraG/TraD family ATPase VirD4
VVDNGDIYQSKKLTNSINNRATTQTTQVEEQEVLFDCTNPKSSKFNWIPYCKNEPYLAQSIAQASLFSRNQEISGFHYGVATDFLAAIYAYTSTLENPTPITAYNLISNNRSVELIERLSKSSNQVVSTFLPLVTTMDKKVIAAYLSGIKNKLSWLEQEQVVSFTNTPDLVDFTRLRKEKVGVYITISQSSLYLASHHLSRIILTCAISQLIQDYKGRSVYFFIRHLTDIGYFSYLHALSQLSQYNIGFIACSQTNIAAWLDRYDEMATKDILAAFHTKIFLEDGAYSTFLNYLPANQQLNQKSLEQNNTDSLSIQSFHHQLILINGQQPFQTLCPTLKDVSDPYFLNSTTLIAKTNKLKG